MTNHIGAGQSALDAAAGKLLDKPEFRSLSNEPFSLSMFALNGQSEAMRSKMLDDKYILGRLAILGQLTVFYAPPNAGKTLLTMSMLIDAIESGEINGEDVFYINADDNYAGLVTKLTIAEQHGFLMVAPGFNGFEAVMLTQYMHRMIADDTARGKVVILDTLKKFCDVMDKGRSSQFGKTLREFASHGGSVVMLAHVNKHRSSDGKVIAAGTSDITDDADCAYTLDAAKGEGGTVTAIFENTKCRGDVAATASYEYTRREGQAYEQLLDTVRPVSDAEVRELREANHLEQLLKANRPLIVEIAQAINEGINQRTELINTVHASGIASKAKVTKVLEAHTGEDYLAGHRWRLERGEKNAHVYKLLWAWATLETVKQTTPSEV